MTEKQYDIVIVGAGIVGSALACCLATENNAWRIGIIEPSPSEKNAETFDPRVVALTETSRSLLDKLNVWQEISSVRACPFYKMHVWDGEGGGLIDFNSAEIGSATLGHIVENRVVLQALHCRMKALKNIFCITGLVENLKLSEQQLILASGEKISATLIVAADGAQSCVRELANIQTREWAYHQHAIVTTVKMQKPHDFTARQRFMSTGPLAFLPLQTDAADSKGHYCSIVWSADSEYAQALMTEDDATFCASLEAAFESRLGKVESTAKRYCIQLQQRHAKTYIASGLALVGDAAHSIHPLAGQGVNLGLLDIACLAGELARAKERSIPLGDNSVLRRYQRQRMTHNLTLMAAMESFKQLFGSRKLGVLWLRNLALSKVNNLSVLKQLLMREAMGLK